MTYNSMTNLSRAFIPTATLLLICFAASAMLAAHTARAVNFGNDQVVHSFGSAANDGLSPTAGLLLGSDGNFYGTTPSGGLYGEGTIYEYSSAGVYTILYSFGSSVSDGSDPVAGLVQDSNGNFYGTTKTGGYKNKGTVFEYSATGTYSTLYIFGSRPNDGVYPAAPLIVGNDGSLYGTTGFGGVHNEGTIFRLTEAGEYATLFSFGTNATDGNDPVAGLTMDVDGNLYGTTLLGPGAGVGYGTVFELSPTGTMTNLYTFGLFSGDGQYPDSPLIVHPNLYLVGTTIQGGEYGFGTFFSLQLTRSGDYTDAYSFGASGDGQYPMSNIFSATDGNVYGTTSSGGTYGGGTLWQYASPEYDGGPTFKEVYEFGKTKNDAAEVSGTIIEGSDGNFYGTSAQGGTVDGGTIWGIYSRFPRIFSFSPAAATVGSTITISGANFTGATTVEFSYVSKDTFTVVSPDTIEVVVPPGQTSGRITVVTPTGKVLSPTVFTLIPTLTITSISPTSGPVGTKVHIEGANLTDATAVLFNGTKASFGVSNDNISLDATVPAGATSGPITVQSLYNSPTSATSFTVVPTPTVTSFTPSSGTVGTTVTITGTNFNGTTSITFDGTPATTVRIVSNTSVRVQVPSGAHTGLIILTTPYGSVASKSSFTVIPIVTLTSFSPESGPVGTAVTITGSYFTGATAVTFDGTAATSVKVVSDTSIQTIVPAGATTGTVSVTTPDGTATSASAFTVIDRPAITSFSPGAAAAGAVVTITGTNLTGATALTFNGTPVSKITVLSSTSIRTLVPSGATSGFIAVTTPGGSATSTSSFTVLTPAIVSSFTPTSGGAGTFVTITGANFTGATAIQFGGKPATTFAVHSDTSATAYVPVGALTGPISVVNPSGTGASTTSFTVIPTPVIASFTPASGPIGTVVTITGKYFTNASAVAFNGFDSTSFQVVSSTTITATVSKGASSGPIALRTPGGRAQSSAVFTVTSP